MSLSSWSLENILNWLTSGCWNRSLPLDKCETEKNSILSDFKNHAQLQQKGAQIQQQTEQIQQQTEQIQQQTEVIQERDAEINRQWREMQTLRVGSLRMG